MCSSIPEGHEKGGRVSSMCRSDPRGHERGGRVSFFPLSVCSFDSGGDRHRQP